jgi:hypothetical protein
MVSQVGQGAANGSLAGLFGVSGLEITAYNPLSRCDSVNVHASWRDCGL